MLSRLLKACPQPSLLRMPVATAILALIAAGLYLSPLGTRTFELHREMLARGEIWRVVTSHWAHFGAEHLLWDVAAFIMLGSLIEARSRQSFLVCVAAAAVVVGLAVVWWQPQLINYRGLSGIDSALFGWVTMDIFRAAWRERSWGAASLALIALAGFAMKSGYELHTGRAFFVGQSDVFSPVPLAHAAGLVTGVLVSCLPMRRGTTEPISPTAAGQLSA